MTKQEQIEYLEEIFNLKKSIDSRRKFSTIVVIMFMLLFITLMTSLFIAVLNEDEKWGSKRFAKEEIQNKLALTIGRGGSLESVKHIYAARKYKNYSLLDLFKSDNDKYYYEPTSLSFILNDLLVNSYQDSTYQDNLYITNLTCWRN